MLSDGCNDRLMIGGGVDRAEAVCTGIKTISNICCKDTTLCGTVQALIDGNENTCD